MRQYKVEALAFFPELSFDKEKVIRTSQAAIQQVLDDYARRGWRLVSTNATDSGRRSTSTCTSRPTEARHDEAAFRATAAGASQQAWGVPSPPDGTARGRCRSFRPPPHPEARKRKLHLNTEDLRVEAFTIRACGPGEAGRLAATGAHLFTQAYGPTHPEPELSAYLARAFAPARLAAELADPGRRALVAESGGRWIGYAYLQESAQGWPSGVPGQRPVEIVRFYVDAGWHGRGVAAALMAACEDEARGRGADALWLGVWQEAARPIAFYRRAGFEVVGTATFTFGDRLDDDWVMARRLAGADLP